MQIQAVSRSVRISPRKVRLVADAVRSLPVEKAIASLHVMNKRAAYAIEKTLQSAVANAVNNARLDRAVLTIASIEVSDGQALKRFHPSTRGRIHPYKRRSSHIRVVLEEKRGEAVTSAPAPIASEPAEAHVVAAEPVKEKKAKKEANK